MSIPTGLCLIICNNNNNGRSLAVKRQERSYRKQIARQLRTQYVDGIYRPKYYTVTLKGWLEVTQDH